MPPKQKKKKVETRVTTYPKSAEKVRDKVNLRSISQIYSHSWCRLAANSTQEKLRDVDESTALAEKTPDVELLLNDSQAVPNYFGVIVHFGVRLYITESGLEALPDLAKLLRKALKTDKIPPEERVLVEVEAQYFLEMLILDNKGITNKDIEAFAHHNAPNFAWGLWREFVHSASGRMGIPAITLNILLPGALRPKDSSEEDSKASNTKKPKKSKSTKK